MSQGSFTNAQNLRMGTFASIAVGSSIQISLFVVFTMYGGGFATIPAFLADLFGSQNVGAIHGAVLTAWSAAAGRRGHGPRRAVRS